MTTRVLRPTDHSVRAKRIDTNHVVRVESKTLGTLIQYNLNMDNISRTGLLMSCERQQRLPYQINTLVELVVDPRAEVLTEPVNCLGKIVRALHDDALTVRFGVQIIMMEARDEALWQETLAVLEGTSQGGEQAQLPAAS